MHIRRMLLVPLAAIGLNGNPALLGVVREADLYNPRSEDCLAEQLPDDMFSAVQQLLLDLQATPSAQNTTAEPVDPLDAEVLSQADLPAGTPADDDTVSAVTRIEEEYAACFNAGEFRKAASLMVGEGQLVVVSLASSLSDDIAGTPVPPPEEFRIPSVAVSQVRILADGRAGAIVDWGQEHNFHVYEQVDGQWRISDEISLFD